MKLAGIEGNMIVVDLELVFRRSLNRRFPPDPVHHRIRGMVAIPQTDQFEGEPLKQFPYAGILFVEFHEFLFQSVCEGRFHAWFRSSLPPRRPER